MVLGGDWQINGEEIYEGPLNPKTTPLDQETPRVWRSVPDKDHYALALFLCPLSDLFWSIHSSEVPHIPAQAAGPPTPRATDWPSWMPGAKQAAKGWGGTGASAGLPGCLLGITELLLYPHCFAGGLFTRYVWRVSRARQLVQLSWGSSVARAHHCLFSHWKKKRSGSPLLQPQIGVVTGAKLLSFTAKSRLEDHRQECSKQPVYFEKTHWLSVGFRHLRKQNQITPLALDYDTLILWRTKVWKF